MVLVSATHYPQPLHCLHVLYKKRKWPIFSLPLSLVHYAVYMAYFFVNFFPAFANVFFDVTDVFWQAFSIGHSSLAV